MFLLSPVSQNKIARLEASNAAEMAVQANQSASFGFRTASPSQKLSSKPIAHISLSTKLKPSSRPSLSCSTWNQGQIPARHSCINPGIFAYPPSNLTFSHELPESESPPLGKVSHRQKTSLGTNWGYKLVRQSCSLFLSFERKCGKPNVLSPSI